MHSDGAQTMIKLPRHEPSRFMPRFPEFKPVELEDKECLTGYFRKHPPKICEFTFGNVFTWRRFDHPKYTILNHNLCLLFEPPIEPAFFLPPVGDRKIEETVETCLSYAPRLARVPESFVNKYCKRYRTDPDRNNYDYVYLAQDLMELKGKKYDGKRNRIRRFMRHHDHQYQKLGREHLRDCARLFEEWLGQKTFQEWIERVQREALKEALDNFEELNLTGGAILVNDRIEAFSLGEELNPDTAVIHFEVANPKFEGLAQLINREFVRNEWAGYKFINREQDLGLPGLRKAKLSYHPHHLVKKYQVTL